MTPDQYVESVLAKYQVPRGPTSPAELLGSALAGPLRTWAGQQLNALEYSGSYAKDTGVHGVSDVDLFISPSPFLLASIPLWGYCHSFSSVLPCSQCDPLRMGAQ